MRIEEPLPQKMLRDYSCGFDPLVADWNGIADHLEEFGRRLRGDTRLGSLAAPDPAYNIVEVAVAAVAVDIRCGTPSRRSPSDCLAHLGLNRLGIGVGAICGEIGRDRGNHRGAESAVSSDFRKMT